jgi:hypothetical protein
MTTQEIEVLESALRAAREALQGFGTEDAPLLALIDKAYDIVDKHRD